MVEFQYEPMFKLDKDETKYRKLTDQFVTSKTLEGHDVLEVKDAALQLLSKEALEEVSHYLRTSHLGQVAAILKDPEASDNDRYVAETLIKNAVVSARGELPMCQDTGTAVVFAKKGQYVWTEGQDEEVLSKGIYDAYEERNFRYSQIAALSMFEEKNTQTNLPAQIDIQASYGSEYRFLFLAKGGGSANKTFLYQETRALLNEKSLTDFIRAKLFSLGTAACPPYHIAIVIGGTSAEFTLKTVKLASAGYLDHLPSEGSSAGTAFRDREWEAKVLHLAQESGIGAQFGGKYLAHDVRVIRLPRHAASCPVGIGVSCSADRNIKGIINKEGVFLEVLDHDPDRFLPTEDDKKKVESVRIDLEQPMKDILAKLSKYPVKTRLLLSGTLIVARDVAHARILKMLEDGKPMPDYFKEYPIYYAGPAKTPEGMPTGSFGPTTAGRMDSYVARFMAAGGSLIMLAKGNRSEQVRLACKQFGGFYLGSIGGPAAVLAKDNIESVEVVDFEDLGMEAVRKIKIKDFPAFIVTDDKGNDFFASLNPSGNGAEA